MSFYTTTELRKSAERARRSVRRLAKQMGVTIEERLDGSWHELLLTAPPKKRFVFSDLHEHVIANAGPTTDMLWERALETLEHEDLIVCPDEDCE